MNKQENNIQLRHTFSDYKKEQPMDITSKGKKFPNKLLRILLVGLLTLVLIGGGVYLWAHLSTGTSLAARGIIWGGSRFDDWQRFPSRVVHAGDDPVYFPARETNLFDDFAIDGRQLEDFLEATNTTAFLVLHDDTLLYEGYFNGSSHEATQASMSVAKSFVSTLVGIAIEEGFISSLEDPVTTYIPELIEHDPRFADITIRHLLMMTSGLRFVRDDSNPFSDDFITSHSPNMREAALNTEIVEAPGRRFHYNDYNPQLLGMVLERATGMSVSEYLATRLWGPMGAEADGSWDLDSEQAGFERMSVGLNGQAVDFAKLGWLFLHGGKAGDQQIIPQAWVDQATNPDAAIYTDRADHAYYYQHYWWLDIENDAFYAEGNFCQFIYVYPAADLVLVRHGSDCGGAYWTGLLGEIAQAIEGELKR